MNSELRYRPPEATVADVPEIEPSLVALNPWFSIWTRPRATIQQIVDTDPNRLVIALSMLIGVTQVLDRASARSLGDRLSLGAILGTALVLGPFLGPITVQIFAWLLSWTGRMLGGRAPLSNIRAALVWGNVPALWAALSFIPAIAVLRHEIFTSETPQIESNFMLLLTLLGVGVVQVVGGIWTIFAICNALGQVQGFSAWRALANSLLALLVVLVPVVLIALLVLASR